jgi:hypothetical protein
MRTLNVAAIIILLVVCVTASLVVPSVEYLEPKRWFDYDDYPDWWVSIVGNQNEYWYYDSKMSKKNVNYFEKRNDIEGSIKNLKEQANNYKVWPNENSSAKNSHDRGILLEFDLGGMIVAHSFPSEKNKKGINNYPTNAQHIICVKIPSSYIPTFEKMIPFDQRDTKYPPHLNVCRDVTIFSNTHVSDIFKYMTDFYGCDMGFSTWDKPSGNKYLNYDPLPTNIEETNTCTEQSKCKHPNQFYDHDIVNVEWKLNGNQESHAKIGFCLNKFPVSVFGGLNRVENHIRRNIGSTKKGIYFGIRDVSLHKILKNWIAPMSETQLLKTPDFDDAVCKYDKTYGGVSCKKGIQ